MVFVATLMVVGYAAYRAFPYAAGAAVCVFLIIAWTVVMINSRDWVTRQDQESRRDLVLMERVQGLRQMIAETVSLSKDLEDYLNGRLAAMEELEQRVKEGEQAASLTEDQLKLMDARLDRQFKRSGRVALWQQAVFMVAGVILGLLVLPVWHWIVQ